jgi:hypothetical protein
VKISKPLKEEIPPKGKSQWSQLTRAMSGMRIGQAIAIDPFEFKKQKRAYRVAEKAGRKITTRKTESGTLKIWRVA